MSHHVRAVVRAEVQSVGMDGKGLWHLTPVYVNEKGDLSYEQAEGFHFAFNMPLGPVTEFVQSVVLADVATGELVHAQLDDPAQQEPLLANLRAQDDPRVDNAKLVVDVKVTDGALVADPAVLDATVADAVAASVPVDEPPVKA